jgi:hypothetical protein
MTELLGGKIWVKVSWVKEQLFIFHCLCNSQLKPVGFYEKLLLYNNFIFKENTITFKIFMGGEKNEAVYFTFFNAVVCWSGINANSSYAYFKRITTTNGLSNGWVRCIYQDDYDFIWVGTSDGLNRYDGVTFKTYRPVLHGGVIQGNITVNCILKKDEKTLGLVPILGFTHTITCPTA